MAIKYCVAVLAFFSLYISPIKSISYCPDPGMEVWEDHCYYFHGGQQYTWDEAEAICEGMGSTLASIHSQEEEEHIRAKMKPISPSRYWIGRRMEAGSSGTLEDYKWVDGTVADYEFWYPDSPKGINPCVRVNVHVGLWADWPCSLKHDYVCKAPLVRGWQEYNGKEYYISTYPGEIESTWYEAHEFCMQQGGDVASILDEDEVKQVTKWATKTAYQGRLWIGLNKLAGDRKNWGWSDGSSFSSTWNNWESLYPMNDKYGYLCGYQTSLDVNGKWKNGHCDTKMGFLCKRSLGSSPTPKTTTPTPTVPGYCPAGYYGSGNKCFKVVLPGHFGDDALTFDEAVVKCRQEPGRLPSLASIQNEVDQAFINAHLTSLRLGAWIGLRREPLGSTWEWVDSSPQGYENWSVNKPDSSNGDCTEVGMLPGTIGKWNNIKCSDKRGYVCQTYKDAENVIHTSAVPKVNFTCPADFTAYWYGCYKYQPTAWSWDTASAECRKLDPSATLVGIHAEAENAAMQTLTLTHGKDIWLGFRDKNSSIGDNGEYKWEDGWHVLWTNWANGQPVKESQGGCVRMSSDGRWSDDVCSKQYPSVCKISQTPALTTPATLPGKCPTGGDWFELGEHCYFLVPDGYVTWELAKKECQKKAFLSSLASIHSYIENKNILDRLNLLGYGNKDMWIGLYRSKLDSTQMKWTDGSALQYEAWAHSEPNGEEDKEDCVKMWNREWSGKWGDDRCSAYYGYICKAPKVPHVTLPTSSPKCDPGWHHSLITGHCYLFKPDDSRPFSVALKMCRDMDGSDLASIHDAFEMREVREGMKLASVEPPGVMNNRYWFGMAMNETEKDEFEYYWTDGTDRDYDNWADGEPNYPDTNRCVYADNGYNNKEVGKWNAITCKPDLGYVCKKPNKDEAEPTDDSTSVGVVVAGGHVSLLVISALLGLMSSLSPSL